MPEKMKNVKISKRRWYQERLVPHNTQKTNRCRWPTTICGGLSFPQADRKLLGKRGS